MEVSLVPWSPDDLGVLERANTPEMTEHLGGPETGAQVRARHERYLHDRETGASHMFRIDVDGHTVGGIGYWPIEFDGQPAYEAGWSVEPAWQGRGVATEALRRLVGLVSAAGDRRVLAAFPWPSNAASNAMCRRAGFALRGTSSGPWRGRDVTYNEWVLDLGAE